MSPPNSEERRAQMREASRRWRQRNPGAQYASTRAWWEANRQKRNAQTTLQRAVRAGKIERPGECERCQKACRPHAHHNDYAKPLEVEWLCPPCHAVADGRTLQEAA